MHGLRIPTKSAGDAGLMSATTAVAVVPDELLTGIKGASVLSWLQASRPLRPFLLVVIGIAVFVILVLVFDFWRLEILALGFR